MVKKARRGRISDDPGSGDVPSWEVFIRDTEDDPVEHVGQVTAQTADEAHEEVSRLFAWFADDVWICPANEVVHYSTAAADETESTPEDGSEHRTHEL